MSRTGHNSREESLLFAERPRGGSPDDQIACGCHSLFLLVVFPMLLLSRGSNHSRKLAARLTVDPFSGDLFEEQQWER